MHGSGVHFPDFWSFHKLKERGPNFLGGGGGEPILQKAGLFGPPFSISILKVFRTQILRHSLDFNVFCMIQEYFSQTFQIPQI